VNSNLTDVIRRKADKLGIDLVGIVPAEKIDDYSDIWVEWEEKKLKKTTAYIEDARSVIVLGFSAEDKISDLAVNKENGWEYAGEMRLSLRQRDLALELKEEGLDLHTGYPDISYKNLARLAGLGSFGKSSLIVTQEFGPQVRWRCLITDTVLEYDEPLDWNPCGECNLCIEACPTDAISDYEVDPEKCLAGIHVKDKEAAPDLLAEYEPEVTDNSHLMCRECQEVCPHSS
jgi:epoxyqueuosine reductase